MEAILSAIGLFLGAFYFVIQRRSDHAKWTRQLEAEKARAEELEKRLHLLAENISGSQVEAAHALSKTEEQRRIQADLAREMSDKERYLRIIMEENSELNIQGLRTRCPVYISLREVYVPMCVRVAMLDNLREHATDVSVDVKDSTPSPQREFDGRDRHSVDLSQLFHIRARLRGSGSLPKVPPRLVAVGGPGSGKSTFIQFASLVFAQGENEKIFKLKGTYIPLVVRLREVPINVFRNQSLATIAFNIAEKKGYAMPLSFFQQHLANGDCVVFLDGLDEVPTSESRNRVLSWLRQATATYSKSIFVITTRPAGYPEHLLGTFARVDVLPFLADDIKNFCSFWTKAVETTLRGDTPETRARIKALAADLTSAIEANPEITLLASNPLMLSIVCLVHRYRARLPERRVDLYTECLDVLLEHWDAVRELPVPFRAHQALQVLQPLALAYHLQGVKELQETDVVSLLRLHMPRIGITDNTEVIARQFLTNIRDRSGVLTGYSGTSFGFVHLTFQEFLTAKELINADKEEILVQKYADPFWREVVLLYAGLRDCTSLMRALLAADAVRVESLDVTLGVLHDAVSCDPNVRDQIVERDLTVAQELDGERPGDDWLKALLQPGNAAVLRQFLERVMLGNVNACISQFAAWKYFRYSEVQSRWPEAFDRMEREVEFAEALKGTPKAIRTVAGVLLDMLKTQSKANSPNQASQSIGVEAAPQPER